MTLSKQQQRKEEDFFSKFYSVLFKVHMWNNKLYIFLHFHLFDGEVVLPHVFYFPSQSLDFE